MADLKKKLLVYLPILISAAILAWLIYPSFPALKRTLAGASGAWLAVSLLFAVSSYTCMSLTLWEVLSILGFQLPFWETGGIALVSTTVNYFFSSGGVSGFATRAHLLCKRRVPYGISVTSSVVISVLIYLVLSLIILQGVLLRLIDHPRFDLTFFEGVIGVMLILGFAFALTTMLFHHELRSAWGRKVYDGVNYVMYFFSKREIPEETFLEFEGQLNEGIHKLHDRKFELQTVIAYVCADWISTIFILYFAFKAVGVDISSGVLVTGFAFGMLMTIIPILPGGLGAMEAAMTASYAQMGIPWEKALAAALIFRLFYYLLPAFFSIFIYWGLKMSEPFYDYFHPENGEECPVLGEGEGR